MLDSLPRILAHGDEPHDWEELARAWEWNPLVLTMLLAAAGLLRVWPVAAAAFLACQRGASNAGKRPASGRALFRFSSRSSRLCMPGDTSYFQPTWSSMKC